MICIFCEQPSSVSVELISWPLGSGHRDEQAQTGQADSVCDEHLAAMSRNLILPLGNRGYGLARSSPELGGATHGSSASEGRSSLDGPDARGAAPTCDICSHPLGTRAATERDDKLVHSFCLAVDERKQKLLAGRMRDAAARPSRPSARPGLEVGPNAPTPEHGYRGFGMKRKPTKPRRPGTY